MSVRLGAPLCDAISRPPSIKGRNHRLLTPLPQSVERRDVPGIVYARAVRSTIFFFLMKTQLCKLRVILGSRVLRGVYTLVKDTGR